MSIPTSPSTALYTLGRGALYVAAWDGVTPPAIGDFEDVGDCQEFTVEVTEEKLEHFTRRSGTRNKDRVVTLESGYELSFILNESSVNNLKRYLRGTLEGTNTIQANTALTAEFALRFITDNATGPNELWEFWKLELSPNGSMNLLSDEWRAIPFSGTGLADSANKPNSPFFNVTMVAEGETVVTTTT